MSTKRVLFLGACVALAASGADARALLQDPGAVAADPEDLACVACKKFVADGEEYINDPSTLDQVSEEIKELCEDQAGERAEMVRSVREGGRARNARRRARDPRRARVASHPTSPRKSSRASQKGEEGFLFRVGSPFGRTVREKTRVRAALARFLSASVHVLV
tara:strand:- start:99 stop:587 length:489 start_codon:yes stop_codon:yes gene_type:complete